jgi:hypothetical protein
VNGSGSGITVISIPELEEKNKQPILDDPLDKSDFAISINKDNTGDAINGKISILNKFWINNGALNQGFTGYTNMGQAGGQHTHTKDSNSM